MFLAGAAVTSFILAASPPGAKHLREVATFATGLLMQISGHWFATIGFAFYWYSESDGLLGNKKGNCLPSSG